MGNRYGDYKNRYEIVLSEEQRAICRKTIYEMRYCLMIRLRARLFLDLDDLRKNRDVSITTLAKNLGYSGPAIYHILKQYKKLGFDSLYLKSGRKQGYGLYRDKIVSLLQTSPPPGERRWHARLIKEQLKLPVTLQTVYNYLYQEKIA